MHGNRSWRKSLFVKISFQNWTPSNSVPKKSFSRCSGSNGTFISSSKLKWTVFILGDSIETITKSAHRKDELRMKDQTKKGNNDRARYEQRYKRREWKKNEMKTKGGQINNPSDSHPKSKSDREYEKNVKRKNIKSVTRTHKYTHTEYERLLARQESMHSI